MVMGELTVEEKQGLSDEEIEALEDDYEDDEPVPDADPGADDAGKKGKDDKGEDEDQPDEDKADAEKEAKDVADRKAAEDEKRKADEEAAAQKASEDAQKAAEEAKKKAPAAQSQPTPIVPKFPEIKPEVLGAAKTKMEELKAKLDDGEPVFEEYQEARDDYKSLLTKKEIYDEGNKAAQEAVAEASKQGWAASQKAFLSLSENKDFSPDGNLAKYGAFSAHVNAIIAKKEDANLNDFEVLELAKERTLKDLGIKAEEAPGDTDKKKKKALADAKKQHGDRSKIKDDIGDLPGARDDEGDEGEFDYLDRLDGEAYQKAIDKLTPEQQDRYAKYTGGK